MNKYNHLKVILLAVLLSLALCACGGQEQPLPPESVPAEPTAGQTFTEPTQPDAVDDFAIETPYGTLYYPGEWAPLLRTEITEENGCHVAFHADLDSGRQQELFTLTFGGTDPIGAFTAGDGTKVGVSVTLAEFTPDNTWTDSEINVVYAMQDGLNHVLDNLALEPMGAEESPADMALDTPYGELHFPVRWAEYLATEVDETDGYTVRFCARIGDHADQPLFAIHFGGNQGVFYGKTNSASGEGAEIRVTVSEISLDESWTDAETSLVYAMQEDLNYLLEHMN